MTPTFSPISSKILSILQAASYILHPLNNYLLLSQNILGIILSLFLLEEIVTATTGIRRQDLVNLASQQIGLKSIKKILYYKFPVFRVLRGICIDFEIRYGYESDT